MAPLILALLCFFAVEGYVDIHAPNTAAHDCPNALDESSLIQASRQGVASNANNKTVSTRQIIPPSVVQQICNRFRMVVASNTPIQSTSAAALMSSAANVGVHSSPSGAGPGAQAKLFGSRDPETNHGLRVLIGVVADSKPETRVRAMRNILAIRDRSPPGMTCRFAFIVYDNAVDDWQDVEKLAAEVNVSVSVLRSHVQDLYPGFLGKVVFQVQLLPLLPSFDLVWLMDADVALAHFSLHDYYSVWRDAFDHGPPLISQPVVRQNTQSLALSNHKTWTEASMLGGLSASAVLTRFVECQMPLMDVGLFAWMMEKMVEYGHLQSYVELRTSWGTNEIWCGLAQRYATEVLHTPARPTCAIIAVPIDHEDSKTTPKHQSDFLQRSYEYRKELENEKMLREVFVSPHQFLQDGNLGSWCRTQIGGSYESCHAPAQPGRCDHFHTTTAKLLHEKGLCD